MMTGFLLVMRCFHNDVPLGLYTTLGEAVAANRAAANHPQAALEAVEETLPHFAGGVWPGDPMIIEFKDGSPLGQVYPQLRPGHRNGKEKEPVLLERGIWRYGAADFGHSSHEVALYGNDSEFIVSDVFTPEDVRGYARDLLSLADDMDAAGVCAS
jgi:hypothetical protein